jgi:PAS domain S-box-containing protein
MDYGNAFQYQAMLAAIIDSSEDAIISKNLDGIITTWNKSAERIFGYSEQEVTGKHISLLIPEERLDEENMIISRLRAGERVEHFETIRRRKDGQLIDISLTVSPVKDDKGKVIGASKIARDITRQKETLALLQQANDRLELIHSVSKTIVSELDAQSILQKVTDATTRISGAKFGAFFYNKIDAKGEAYSLVAIAGARREDFEQFGMPRNTAVFSMTFSGEGIFRSDDITRDPRYGKNSPYHGMPDGHLPVTSYLAVPVISQSGAVTGGLFFGHPEPGVFTPEHESLVNAIATQAAIALDNAKLYEEIKSLNAQKDEFIGFASHELKTPITTAKGYVQLAEKMPAKANEFMEKIGNQLNRLNSIIADLLDISTIQAGRLDLRFRHTSLFELLKSSVEAIGKQGTHTIRVEAPVHDIIVMIDPNKIEQVIVNLLSNAIKYSPGHNEVLLQAAVLGDGVEISVQDWGIGIAKEFSAQVFKRFFRVSRSDKDPKGLGLGLYISQGIVEAHSGKIWVDSEEGAGAVFKFTFPIERAKNYK